jgi:hypothetical protein
MTIPRIFPFENDPKFEQRKRRGQCPPFPRTIINLFKSKRTSKTAFHHQTRNVSVSHRHHYPYSSCTRTATLPAFLLSLKNTTSHDGHLNIYNCKPIFHQCCSMILSISIPLPHGSLLILSFGRNAKGFYLTFEIPHSKGEAKHMSETD